MGEAKVLPVPKAKRPRKPKSPALHPPYMQMIRQAIIAHKERGGSSKQKILAYLMSNYKMGTTNQKIINARLKFVLRIGIKSGRLLGSKGVTGARGKFRLGKEPKAAKPKRKKTVKKAKAKKAKKPAAKKAKSKKVKKAKKPAAKKAKKSPAKKARKPAAKKAKKPAAKKAKKSAKARK